MGENLLSNINVVQVPRTSRTQKPKKKGIVITEISSTPHSVRSVTRSRTITDADRSNKGKQKVDEPPTISVQHATINPMWTVKLCHDDLDVHTE